MTNSINIAIRNKIQDQLDKLEDFRTSLLPNLTNSNAFAYLDRWESNTKNIIYGLLSVDQLQAFKNVRLKQRFELPEEDQILQLISGFKSVLSLWLVELV